MTSTETLLKATLNRLAARFGEKLINTASELSESAKNSPERLKEEWSLFQQEIIEEATRIEAVTNEEEMDISNEKKHSENEVILEVIDGIRKKVTRIAEKIEGLN